MKIDLRDFQLAKKGADDDSFNQTQLSAFQAWVDAQGNLEEVSPEARKELRKLKLESKGDQIPEGLIVDFSLNFLSNEGTWNFHNRRFGTDNSTPIPDDWSKANKLSLESVIDFAQKSRRNG